MGVLYLLTFPNGKEYIGITKGTAEHRFAVHYYQRNRQTRPLYHALRKCSRDEVIVETLATGEWDELCELERAAIAERGTKWPNGYNLTDGGEVPTGLTEASLAKMSAVHTGNSYRKGMTFTAESRAKMSAARRGKCFLSAAGKEALRERMRGNKFCLGTTQSAETRRKRSTAHISRGLRSTNKSGHKGVTWCAQTKKWRATITVDRKCVDLGRHADIQDAVYARQIAEERILSERAA